VSSAIQTTVDAVSLGGLYVLLALGIALIFGIMDLINFAYGELMMIGGYTLVFLSDTPLPFMLAATIGVVVVAALLMDRVAFRPARGADPTTLLVTSFAVSYCLQNLAILIFGSFPKTTSVGSGISRVFFVGGVGLNELEIIVIGVGAGLVVALTQLIRRTHTGIRMRAAAEDFGMARVLGVNADRIVAVGFAISGLLAAVAAYFLVAQTGSVSPLFGVNPVLIAFVATILGGLGSLAGAMLAGFGLGVATTVLQEVLPEGFVEYRDTFVYVLVLVTLILRPEGLIPQRARAFRI
jgi:branched-chain amino acid transport system permease protein